ncbi:beta-fructofuranosidase [Lactobacillus colini]|uniref:beta-fructofuranosidase n=1 Tax=Lactobacillus colini TaxID=1819254 RepID=A0ABS4MGM0_9LACO|nr:glycoside hydrolase family 32 protein [Lactobacillus colini]MBP2058833.1 beta-fructofuranosidase [Lactobacillus colini]
MNANEYIYKKIRTLDGDDLRPKLHFTAPYGWLNDPNGLIFYKNYYHLFYQYNPYGTMWDTMHWGHARSKDLIHWQDLPIAMFPDHDYDKGGVFSGSSIEKDGRLYVIYTGHVISEDSAVETQCVAWSDDGINFTKYENNPVMTYDDVPGANNPANFRDPKVFEHDGKYYCVLAAEIQSKGSIVLFESKDLLSWHFKKVLLQDNKILGIMTECPDFFSVAGNDYILFSSIFGIGQNSIVYAAQGKMDWSNFDFEINKIKRVDQSDDFYASQSLVDKDNRRIMIPWLRSVDHTDYLSRTNHSWNGMMGIPRIMENQNKNLIQKPIGTIKELSKDISNISLGVYRITDFLINQKLILKGKNGQAEILRYVDRYLISIDSPVFKRKFELKSNVAEIEFVNDDSVLEFYSNDAAMSIVTFITGIDHISYVKEVETNG